jgi:hypothetical protein
MGFTLFCREFGKLLQQSGLSKTNKMWNLTAASHDGNPSQKLGDFDSRVVICKYAAKVVNAACALRSLRIRDAACKNNPTTPNFPSITICTLCKRLYRVVGALINHMKVIHNKDVTEEEAIEADRKYREEYWKEFQVIDIPTSDSQDVLHDLFFNIAYLPSLPDTA